MPFIGSIVSSIASKILPNMGAIGKAISAITQGPMGMLGGISSISKSMGNLFNKIGDFAKTLQKGLGGMFRPSGFGAMPRPSISNFLKGYMAGRRAGFQAGFEAGQKVGQAQSEQQAQQTGGTSRKPGESIEDFISRILNNLIKKTEKNLEDAAKKADGSKKVTQEQQTEIQKLQQQLTQLQQLLQNTMKNFHDTKMNAVRNIAG